MSYCLKLKKINKNENKNHLFNLGNIIKYDF